jgi:hypothetical protein
MPLLFSSAYTEKLKLHYKIRHELAPLVPQCWLPPPKIIGLWPRYWLVHFSLLGAVSRKFPLVVKSLVSVSPFSLSFEGGNISPGSMLGL